MRYAALCCGLLSIVFLIGAKAVPVEDQTFAPGYAPSGQLMYKQYCAACHGADARGKGPLHSILTTPPPDLTQLARRNRGKFPYDYVANVLRFGPGVPAHGTSDMPTWGPIFGQFEKHNQRAVEQRIKKLCDYLASLQE